jgi:hypothetical protein
MATIIGFHAPAQGPGSQPDGAKRKRRYPKRMPSSLSITDRAIALSSLLRGRSLHEVSLELSVASAVPTEIWLRNLEKRLVRLEKLLEHLERQVA